MSQIICILPKGEGFSPQQFGAVTLCVRDFTQSSRYRADTVVAGSVAGAGFDGIRYASLARVRWYENRTRGYARQCAELIRREQAQLVEIHNRPNLLRLLVSKVSCKFALHFHNDPQEIDYSRTPRERTKLLELASAVYCVSGYIRERFLEGLPANAQAKVHLIYNGLEIPASVPQKENLIVFAGRMTEGKGALLLAEALRIALPRMPGWKAVLIGSRRHSPAVKLSNYEKQIEATLTPLGEQVELPGFLLHPETLAFFARAAIAVVPSLWQEPFGRTALEAMAYGCAVISSGQGALYEVTGDAAITMGDLTPTALADALLSLAQNQQERERLQKAARERAPRFSIAECTRALDDARDSVLATAKGYAA